MRTIVTRLKLIPFVIVLTLVSGCQVQNHDQTNDAASLSSSKEPAPSVTATQEAATPGSSLPTPSFLSFDIAKGILLSTGTSDTCKLPCWNDLRIGVSDKADVQRVFRKALKADAGFDFFNLPDDIGPWLRQRGMPDNTYTGGYHWDFRDPTTGVGGQYDLYAVMDSRDNKLAALVENMTSFYSYDVPNLREILSKLGQPDRLVIHDDKTSQIVYAAMYYRQGIRVTAGIAKNLEDPATPNLCVDRDPIIATYLLSAPYSGFSAAEMTPLQAAFGTSEDGESIEDMFGISIDELMELIGTDQQCISFVN